MAVQEKVALPDCACRPAPGGGAGLLPSGQLLKGSALTTPLPAAPDPAVDRDGTLAMFSTLGDLALARGVPLRSPPPQPDSCCGRGCNGCVWESYYAAAACWQQDALIAMGLEPPA
jgi:hypothetical protein